jgi:hypothetical protein
MVKYLTAFLIMLGSMLEGIPTNNVTADVQWNSIYENTPFTITIQVTHDAGEKIDNDSFLINGKKITPKFINEIKISPSSPLEIATYEYEMPGLPRGLQTLPTITVLIGSTKVSSIPSGFEVQSKSPGVSASAPPKGAYTPTTTPFIKLQEIFTASPPVYPGQIFYLGYRYLYNANVDLSEEKLPLLETTQLKKIGDKIIENGDEGGVSVSQIVQKFQAVDPQTIIFPPSKVAGYAYSIDQAGKKYYKEPVLSSGIDALKLEVSPFPSSDKPPSFNGTLGEDYTFSAKLMGGEGTIHPGDKIQLLLTVSGKGDLEQVKPPELCCQPGYSGNFKASDLPPVVTMNQGEKNFLVDFIVQNDHVSSLPPIEFSFFNPETRSYTTLKSKEIPLTVASLLKPVAPPAYSPPELVTSPAAQENPVAYSFTLPLSIGLILAAGLAFLLFVLQYSSAKKKGVEKKSALPKSRELLIDASSHLENETLFYPLVSRALRQALVEKGIILNPQEPLEKIPEGPYKTLLVKIEQERFANQGTTVVADDVLKEADRLIPS